MKMYRFSLSVFGKAVINVTKAKSRNDANIRACDTCKRLLEKIEKDVPQFQDLHLYPGGVVHITGENFNPEGYYFVTLDICGDIVINAHVERSSDNVSLAYERAQDILIDTVDKYPGIESLFIDTTIPAKVEKLS